MKIAFKTPGLITTIRKPMNSFTSADINVTSETKTTLIFNAISAPRSAATGAISVTRYRQAVAICSHP